MRTPEEVAYAVVKMTIALGNEEKPQELAHALIALLTAWRDECVEEAKKALLYAAEIFIEKKLGPNGELMERVKQVVDERDRLREQLAAAIGINGEIPGLRADLRDAQDDARGYKARAIDAETERDSAAESARMAEDRVVRLVEANDKLRATIALSRWLNDNGIDFEKIK